MEDVSGETENTGNRSIVLHSSNSASPPRPRIQSSYMALFELEASPHDGHSSVLGPGTFRIVYVTGSMHEMFNDDPKRSSGGAFGIDTELVNGAGEPQNSIQWAYF